MGTKVRFNPIRINNSNHNCLYSCKERHRVVRAGHNISAQQSEEKIEDQKRGMPHLKKSKEKRGNSIM